jgi:hypothetical protein
MHPAIVLYVLGALVVLRVLLFIYQTVTSPLRDIPGPFAARFSRLWYLTRVNKGHFEKDNIALHKNYGSLVRIAPNHYSINDPTAIKQIYGIGTNFKKSDWYYAWQ